MLGKNQDAEQFILDPVNYIHQYGAADPIALIDNIYGLFSALGATQKDDLQDRALEVFEKNRQQCLEKLLDFMADTAIMRPFIQRQDWLYVESKVAFILNGLVWVAMLTNKEFEVPANQRELYLRRFCQRFNKEKLLDKVLAPQNLPQWGDDLIELVLATAHFLRGEFGAFELGAEGMLTDLQKDPKRVRWWPPEIASEAEKKALVQRVEAELSRMPVHLGTLLTGSFADPAKRDTWGDVDLHCLCAELPDEGMRAQLVKGIAPQSDDDFACFHFLGVDHKLTMDLCFVSRNNQEGYLHRLEAEGLGDAQANFAREDYAISAYALSRGQILSDPDGLLAGYQGRIGAFPAAYLEHITHRWRPVWQRYSGEFAAAQTQGDRLWALTALNFCNEAALRIALAQQGVYSNPVEPKWIPKEINQLVMVQPSLAATFSRLPGDVGAGLAERFKRISALMI